MKITVTAGHSDTAPGACYFGLREADLMADLRNIVALKLRERGHTVRTDGEGRINKALAYAMAMIGGSDVAIELHTNAFFDPQATGVEVLALPRHRQIAQRLAAAIADVLGLPLRGDGGWRPQEESQHGTLGFVRTGGMVVEVFFLSNPGDLAAYQDRKWLVASAIADAVTA